MVLDRRSMADPLPSGLLEACVVVGPSNDKLKEVYEVKWM